MYLYTHFVLSQDKKIKVFYAINKACFMAGNRLKIFNGDEGSKILREKNDLPEESYFLRKN